MIEGGVVMIVISWILMCTGPAEKMVAGRRTTRPVMIGVILREAYPPPVSSPSLIELVAAIDASFDQDASTQVHRAIGDIYDHS